MAKLYNRWLGIWYMTIYGIFHRCTKVEKNHKKPHQLQLRKQGIVASDKSTLHACWERSPCCRQAMVLGIEQHTADTADTAGGFSEKGE